jgi:hypothetical protein
MLEVCKQNDGRFAVRDIGGPSLNDVLGVFDTQEEADEAMLQFEMTRSAGGLGVMRPGGSQGIG